MDEIIRLSVHAGDFVLPDFNYGCWGKNKRRNGIVRYCLSRELGRTMAQYLGFSEHGINNRVQAIYYPHFDNLFAMRDMVGVWKRYSGYLRLTQYINANYRLFEVLPFVWVNGLSLNRSDLGGVLFSYSGKVQPKRAAYICDFEVSIHEHRLVRGFRLIAREGADGFCILPIDTRYWDLSSSYGLWPLPDPIISPNWPCFIEQDTTFVGRYREWGGDRHKKDYYFNDVDGRGSYYPLTVKKKKQANVNYTKKIRLFNNYIQCMHILVAGRILRRHLMLWDFVGFSCIGTNKRRGGAWLHRALKTSIKRFQKLNQCGFLPEGYNPSDECVKVNHGLLPKNKYYVLFNK